MLDTSLFKESPKTSPPCVCLNTLVWHILACSFAGDQRHMIIMASIFTAPRLFVQSLFKFSTKKQGLPIHKISIRKKYPFRDLLMDWLKIHDDVIKWKHFPRYWPFVRGIDRSPMTSPHKGQWSGCLMFSLIYAWINSWVNNREAGDLRRYRAHYDVTVHNYISFILSASIAICSGILLNVSSEDLSCQENSFRINRLK